MFQTYVGPVQTDSAIAYLRLEGAQAIFLCSSTGEASWIEFPFGDCAGSERRSATKSRRVIFTFRSRESSRWNWNFSSNRMKLFRRPFQEACGPPCPKPAIIFRARKRADGHPQHLRNGGSAHAGGLRLILTTCRSTTKRPYDLLNRAERCGVFQLESGGMCDLRKKFHISSC